MIKWACLFLALDNRKPEDVNGPTGCPELPNRSAEQGLWDFHLTMREASEGKVAPESRAVDLSRSESSGLTGKLT